MSVCKVVGRVLTCGCSLFPGTRAFHPRQTREAQDNPIKDGQFDPSSVSPQAFIQIMMPMVPVSETPLPPRPPFIGLLGVTGATTPRKLFFLPGTGLGLSADTSSFLCQS